MSARHLRPASPRDLYCPTCRAMPGSACKRPSGHAVFGGFHAPRERAFEDAISPELAELGMGHATPEQLEQMSRDDQAERSRDARR